MTDPVDDVYARPSIQYYPVTLVATWAELEPGYSSVAGLGFPGALTQLGQLIGQDGFTLTHSIDDGLPDAVTSTGTFDASPSLTFDLTGAQGQKAAAGSLALGGSSASGTGSGTSFTAAYPSGLAFWDYTIISVTVQDDVELTETSMPVTSFQAWKLLGDTTNSVGANTYRTWVFGRKHFTSGVLPPSFTIDTAANYGWVMGYIVCPKTPGWSALVGVTPGNIELAAETVSQTAHSQTPVSIENRGWTIGAFGAASGAGTWTSSGNTILGQVTGSGISTALIASPLRQDEGTYGMSASSSVATDTVAMVHVAAIIRDFPNMNAASYFSPQNDESPIATFERDTAALTLAVNTIGTSGSGQDANVIYRGQMSEVSVSGDKATLSGVSKTRLLLDNSKLLPTVNGWREGLTTDWVAGWLLANGGQYIGIAPSSYTRWWAPCYGSTHPFVDGTATLPKSYQYRTDLGVDNYETYSPTSVDGPFVTAIFGEQTDTAVTETIWTNDRNWATEVPGIQSPNLTDALSQQNSVGRFSCWLRGDVASTAPVLITDTDLHHLFQFYLTTTNSDGSDINTVRIRIKNDRNPHILMGTDGVTLTGGALPSDGQWHFFSVMYDYANGVAKAQLDGTTWNTSHSSAAAQAMPSSESYLNQIDGWTVTFIRTHLPIADMQFETGMPYSDDFSRFYPTPASPSQNATYRPTRQPLAAMANSTPVQGWSTLQSLAQSTLSHMRIDEDDNAVFVPLEYFGEDDQMEVETLNVLDTDFNAGAVALNVDPTKLRNVITTEFTDTSVATNRSSILDMNTSLAVARGTTTVTFTLDTLTVETHGGAVWWYSTPEFVKLDAGHIAGTTALPDENIMSVNTKSDGSGTVFTSSSFTARIVDWSANSIDVEFVNNYSTTLYLANNGSGIPFLRALGYVVNTSDGYSTVSDPGNSTSVRRERAMTTSVDWIHDRATAEQFGGTLIGILSQPTQEVTVTVQGDPRRIPGKLCQMVDSTGVRASGTWRINQVSHRGNGPMYVQDLSLVRVGEFGNWDESNWDDLIWDE